MDNLFKIKEAIEKKVFVTKDKERIFLAKKVQDGEHFAVENAYDVRDITYESGRYSLAGARPSANIYGTGPNRLIEEARL